MKIAFLAVVSCCCAIARSDDNELPPGYNRTFFVSEIFHKYGNPDYLTYEGFEHLLESLGLGRLKFDISHDVSLHKINGTFKEFHDELKLHKHNHSANSAVRNLTKRAVREYDKIPEALQRGKRCLTPQDLLSTYGLETSHGVVISRKGFVDMCPAIIYELDQKACRPEIAMIESPEEENERHLVWLYATLSILIMSVAGLLCILFVPVVVRDCYKPLLDFLIATGAGTLCGDALLHLLPHVLVHRYEVESKAQPILRGTFTLISVFLFFVIEILLKFMQTQKVLKTTINEELGKMITDQTEAQDKRRNSHHHYHSHQKNDAIASMVIIGDVLHNVTDGLSIGAAFASSISSGFASSIAIFSHELPHELGDYATLISSGMSKKKTLLYNILSSVFSFLGMIIGILLGEIKHASLWINAFTAGSFLYIALSDLVPEMKLSLAESGKPRTMIVHLSGLVCGGFIMFCVALFEENLEELLK
ncbi:UNVERIFIED_CONTAM: hypothetical protein PYX00_006536 [Menopon gallinae]|uniref:Uncharacterized protein n=1 Tax=Menopon gallinae TaxID=328185 RepID=A0AAW2HVT9_9NEOP